MPTEAGERVEVRRLMSWFNDKFFDEVSGPLVTERVYKRFIPVDRAAVRPIPRPCVPREQYQVPSGLYRLAGAHRDWLTGDSLTYADLAAAAHLSRPIIWAMCRGTKTRAAKAWYARIKSRPSFRTLLTETLPGLPPSPSYANLDF